MNTGSQFSLLLFEFYTTLAYTDAVLLLLVIIKPNSGVQGNYSACLTLMKWGLPGTSDQHGKSFLIVDRLVIVNTVSCLTTC